MGMANNDCISIGLCYMRVNVIMDQAFSVCPSLLVIFRILCYGNLVVDNLNVIASEFPCGLNFRVY